MKIRNGFVSNSSSSSFIVAFPEKPKSVEHVQQMMFGDLIDFPNPYVWEGRTPSFPTSQIAQTVWFEIQAQKPNDMKNIIEASDGWMEDAPELDYSPDMTKKQRDIAWKKYMDNYKKYQKEFANRFMDGKENQFVYTFSYSDNDGEYFTVMEHGGIFDNLKHKQISRH